MGGILSALAASIFLILSEKQRNIVLPHSISLAIGSLLAVAFCGLIPHAFLAIQPSQFKTLSAVILGGILIFFILEKLLIWRHCHTKSCVTHNDNLAHKSTSMLIIVGDSIHNFIDGILIVVAFLTDTNLGIMTSLAVVAHKIPQEVGDVAILLQGGHSKSKALLYNILASFATVIGGVLGYYYLEYLHDVLPFLLAFASSSFIYIAAADLIPLLHQKTDIKASLQQIVLILTGIMAISLLHNIPYATKAHNATNNIFNTF